jgi:uracil-DNA glycosylase family 4
LKAVKELVAIQNRVVSCELCPRLRDYCRQVARDKRRAYRDEQYWGRPVPSFGDPGARLLIIGLAPGAHGANRTGRMFTGDRSGDFLYRALYQTGFANQPASRRRDDGLALTGAYITAPVRCAPPGNKPLPSEIRTCRQYLERELDLLTRVRVVVVLGQIAMRVYLSILKDRRVVSSIASLRFGHGMEYKLGAGHPVLLCSYHPSQQNTSTGKLTASMLQAVFARARKLLM